MVYYNFFKPNPRRRWRYWVCMKCAVLTYWKCFWCAGVSVHICGHDAYFSSQSPSTSLARGGAHLVTTGRFLTYSEEFFKKLYSCILSCVLLHHRAIFSSRQKHSAGYAFPFEDLRVITTPNSSSFITQA